MVGSEGLDVCCVGRGEVGTPEISRGEGPLQIAKPGGIFGWMDVCSPGAGHVISNDEGRLSFASEVVVRHPYCELTHLNVMLPVRTGRHGSVGRPCSLMPQG